MRRLTAYPCHHYFYFGIEEHLEILKSHQIPESDLTKMFSTASNCPPPHTP